MILSARLHGEGSLIVSLMTRHQGRQAGLVRGGASSRTRGLYQPGNRVAASWKARLEDHLGQLRCELMEAQAARWFDEPQRLAGLAAACAMVEATLPERIAHPASFEALGLLLQALAGEDWPSLYVHFELTLLRELGYGLDLSACAATGSNDFLAYVSPKSGRAVSLSAGEPYRDRLLKLPSFLVTGAVGGREEVLEGLALSGYFLLRHALTHQAGVGAPSFPAARQRLIERLGQARP